MNEKEKQYEPIHKQPAPCEPAGGDGEDLGEARAAAAMVVEAGRKKIDAIVQSNKSAAFNKASQQTNGE